jgi:hypothetical protein
MRTSHQSVVVKKPCECGPRSALSQDCMRAQITLVKGQSLQRWVAVSGADRQRGQTESWGHPLMASMPAVRSFLWRASQEKSLHFGSASLLVFAEQGERNPCNLDCIVSKLLWEDIYMVFNIMVADFLSIASKWPCNTRFLQFNFVIFAVLQSIWNNILLNRKQWLNMKQVWQLALLYLRN